jgi:transposase
MRKMQDYILKGKHIFVGLEDSKKSWKLCIRSEGQVVHETSMPAEYENLRRYLRGRYPECRVKLMYEAGFGGFWLHDLLVSDGIECVVTPAHLVTQEKVNKVKTDRVDARRLARNLESGDYRACHVPDRERREDRQLVRTSSQIQRIIKATKNRIRKFLDFHGLNAGLPSGKWSNRRYRELWKMILSEPLQKCLSAYLSMLEYSQGLLKELEASLKQLCRKERYHKSVQSKQSLPGVGWLSAIRFTLEWGDLSRFPSGKEFGSFTGLTSSEYSSGEMVYRGRITGQGSRQVRAWLIECAWRARKCDPVLLSKYNSVLGNSGSKKKAIVAVARKLAVRLRAVELSGQSYCVGVIE